MLDVDPDATQAELKRAYRQAARTWHPDRNPSPEAAERFKEVATAWELIGDPTARRRHDLTQGRAAQGQLPEEFLLDVADAIERAEDWLRADMGSLDAASIAARSPAPPAPMTSTSCS